MNSFLPKHFEYTCTKEALDEMLARSRALIEDGVVPRRPLGQCLRALDEVLKFIHSQPVLRAEKALGPEAGRAVLRIAQDLESPADPPLFVALPMSVEHEEAIRTGVLLLAAYRAAVERAATEKNGTVAPQIAADFGLYEALRARDGVKVADGIAQFLSAAGRHPQVLHTAALTPRQLVGLESQERVLRAHLLQRNKQALTPNLPQRLLILHLCLEHFLDRFEATVGARLWQKPDYRDCRLTESGRLIFS